MYIKINKKLARLLVSGILLKEINFTKKVSYYHLLKGKRLSPDSLFLLSLKLSITRRSGKRNNITNIPHSCNKLHYSFKAKTKS